MPQWFFSHHQAIFSAKSGRNSQMTKILPELHPNIAWLNFVHFYFQTAPYQIPLLSIVCKQHQRSTLLFCTLRVDPENLLVGVDTCVSE